MSEFDVSVIIPTKPDRAAMLSECLASIHAQTLDADRFEIVSRCSRRWYPEKVNDLARSARGDRILFIGDDDKLRPTCLERMLDAARETGAHVISAGVQTFSSAGPGGTFMPNSAPWTFESFRAGPPVWITSLVDRAKFLEAGGLDFSRLTFADWALWYELWKIGAKNANVDEILWDYRGHADQASASLDYPASRAQFFAAYPELFP